MHAPLRSVVEIETVWPRFRRKGSPPRTPPARGPQGGFQDPEVTAPDPGPVRRTDSTEGAAPRRLARRSELRGFRGEDQAARTPPGCRSAVDAAQAAATRGCTADCARPRAGRIWQDALAREGGGRRGTAGGVGLAGRT